jgi:hypothetical protein
MLEPRMTWPLRSTPTASSRSFTTTTGQSAGIPASVLNSSRFLPIGALPLATRSTRGQPYRLCLPTFHMEAADRTHAAFMPDTAWPVSGYPPDLSRNPVDAPVLMSTFRLRHFTGYDATSSRSLPDAYNQRLFHLAHHDGLRPTQQVAA